MSFKNFKFKNVNFAAIFLLIHYNFLNLLIFNKLNNYVYEKNYSVNSPFGGNVF